MFKTRNELFEDKPRFKALEELIKQNARISYEMIKLQIMHWSCSELENQCIGRVSKDIKIRLNQCQSLVLFKILKIFYFNSLLLFPFPNITTSSFLSIPYAIINIRNTNFGLFRSFSNRMVFFNNFFV